MPLSLEGRTRSLIARFGDYVQSFGSAPAFNEEQLGAHLEISSLIEQLYISAAGVGQSFSHAHRIEPTARHVAASR